MPKKTTEFDQSRPSSRWIADGQRRHIAIINPEDLDREFKKEWAAKIHLTAEKHIIAFTAEVRHCDKNESSRPVSEPPQAFLLEILVPTSITSDFLANLTEIYVTRWLPNYGARRANWLWHRQCIGLVFCHWFDVGVTAVERVRKAIISWG